MTSQTISIIETPISKVRNDFRTYHGKYVYLPSGDKLEKFKTLSLLTTNYHPTLRRRLNSTEKSYLRFYAETYRKFGTQSIDFKFHIDRYQDLMKSGISWLVNETGDVARRFMDIHDIQTHFSYFDSSKSDAIRYERELAERSLIKDINAGSDHRWLLRHSSLNRPESTEQLELNYNLGRQYYVLSFRCDPLPIQHILFGFYPGSGWATMSVDDNGDINPTSNWNPSFTVFFENLLYCYGLKFSTQLHNYYAPTN
jgi:hypothetical protein